MDQFSASILQTEEYLLEAICFDLVVESPHAELVDLFDVYEKDTLIQEYACCIAHDSCVFILLSTEEVTSNYL